MCLALFLDSLGHLDVGTGVIEPASCSSSYHRIGCSEGDLYVA